MTSAAAPPAPAPALAPPAPAPAGGVMPSWLSTLLRRVCKDCKRAVRGSRADAMVIDWGIFFCCKWNAKGEESGWGKEGAFDGITSRGWKPVGTIRG